MDNLWKIMVNNWNNNGIIYIHIYIYIWANYNDLTATSLEIIVSKRNHLQMAARFRLVNYYYLPRFIERMIPVVTWKIDMSYTRMITYDFIWSWALEYLLDMYTTDAGCLSQIAGTLKMRKKMAFLHWSHRYQIVCSALSHSKQRLVRCFQTMNF